MEIFVEFSLHNSIVFYLLYSSLTHTLNMASVTASGSFVQPKEIYYGVLRTPFLTLDFSGSFISNPIPNFFKHSSNTHD